MRGKRGMLGSYDMDADICVRNVFVRQLFQTKFGRFLDIFKRLLNSFALAVAALQRRINRNKKAILVFFYEYWVSSFFHAASIAQSLFPDALVGTSLLFVFWCCSLTALGAARECFANAFEEIRRYFFILSEVCARCIIAAAEREFLAFV